MADTDYRADFSPVTETSYLTAQNVRQYRAIMRLFYREYEKMHFQLYKEDVLELLHRQEEFADYTMAQLLQDLDALVGWKNLTPLQDPRKVFTIEDYKNKQYRYTMSEYAVEIERLTVRLENLFLESGNLSTNLFRRLEDNLEAAEAIADALRARNLSGMILVDFINMQKKEHNERLMEAMKGFLAKDSVPAYVVDITGLGLMEITRKKKNKSFAEQMAE